MSQNTYLLEVTNNCGDAEVVTKHLIEAENRQKVKYHYHRTQRSCGYTPLFTTDDQYKHMLEAPYSGFVTEIFQIREINSPAEVAALEQYIPNWTIIPENE
jgi:hypothetical protein